jgi:hypothetical protein
LNLSKNVLFLFDGVRIGDSGVGRAALEGSGVAIDFGFDLGFSFGSFSIIRVGSTVVAEGAAFDDDDDDDEAKYTVSVVIKKG